MPFKASPEAVDEEAGRPEPGQLYDHRRSEFDKGPERHLLEVQAGSGDVLAKVAGVDLKAGFEEGSEELGRNQVDLSEIGQVGLGTGEIAMRDERAGVGVAFDAVAFHQHYAVLARFAEVVPAISSNRDHSSLRRERGRQRH